MALPFAEKVYSDDTVSSGIIFAVGLKDSLESGMTKYGRDFQRSGEYKDTDDSRWYKLRCQICQTQVNHDSHGKASPNFRSLAVVNSYANAPFYPDRRYHSFFSHSSHSSAPNCPCYLDQVNLNQIQVIPLRMKPFISIADLPGNDPAPILGTLMRPPKTNVDCWDKIKNWVGGKHELIKSEDEFATFKLKDCKRDRIKIAGEFYSISRIEFGALRTWIPDPTRQSYIPLKFTYNNGGKPIFKLPNGTTKITYICDDRRESLVPNSQITKIMLGNQEMFGHFRNVSGLDICKEWLKKCYGATVDVSWSGTSIKYVWTDDNVKQEHDQWFVNGRKFRICLATFSRLQTELDIRFHDARDSTDSEFIDGIKAEYERTQDKSVLKEFSQGSSPPQRLDNVDPNVQQIHCIEISLGSTRSIIEFGLQGKVFGSLEVISSDEFAQPSANILLDDERASVLEECYNNIGSPNGFIPTDNVYTEAENSLTARMWDILRFSCVNSDKGDGIFHTSSGTKRLKLIHEIMKWKDEESEFITNNGQLNNLATLFSNLMEWSRLPRPDDDDDDDDLGQNRAQWVLRKPRLVGRDDLEWGILFDGRPCSLLLEEGIESTDIYCMNNGLRLLKTNAAIAAGIAISNQLPVMDASHSSAQEHISSLLAYAKTKMDQFENRANRIKNIGFIEYMLAFPEDEEDYSSLSEKGSLGLYSDELRMKNRSRWKGYDGWWKDGQSSVAKLSFDDGEIALHRFVKNDDNFGDQVNTVIDAVVRFKDDRVLCMPLFNSEDIPDEWAKYARAGSKQESYRRYRFMRETVRSFLLTGLLNQYLDINHPDEIPKFLRITIPFEVKSFILWPDYGKSRLGQVSKIDSELASFVSSNTLSQLWF